MDNSIHQFNVKKTNGDEISLEEYKDKVVLIVNTASKCGFTPQLKNMKRLHDIYKEEDFEILAFPSNDFAGQEPLDDQGAEQFCVLKYEAEYPIFAKMKVKGQNASELFDFLGDKSKNGKFNAAPKWNFQKYLIDKEGKLVDFYYSFTKPDAKKIIRKINTLLEA